MSARVVRWAARLPGLVGPSPEALWAVLAAGRPPAGALPAPERPASVPATTWRKLTRLSRFVAVTALEALGEAPVDDRLAVVWGTLLGELEPTGRFLTGLYGDGVASPLAFQSSVYNAPAGNLAILLDHRGTSDTVCAGGATGLAALARAEDLLALGVADRVLLVVGDTLSPTAERAWALNPRQAPPGEGVVALLLGREGGVPATVRCGWPDGPVAVARREPLPAEGALRPVGGLSPERSLGLWGGLGLAGVVALLGRGGVVVDQDASDVATVAWTARVGAHVATVETSTHRG